MMPNNRIRRYGRRTYKRFYKPTYQLPYSYIPTRRRNFQVGELKQANYDFGAIGGTFGTLVSTSYSSVGSTAIVAELTSAIINGAGGQQRIGNKIYLKQIVFKGTITAGDNNNEFRMVIVRPRGTWGFSGNSTAGAISSRIFYGASNQIDAVIDENSWEIVYDKRTYIQLVAAVGDAGAQTEMQKGVSGRIFVNDTIQYDPISLQSQRPYFLVCVSDSSAIPNVSLTGNLMLRYKDA